MFEKEANVELQRNILKGGFFKLNFEFADTLVILSIFSLFRPKCQLHVQTQFKVWMMHLVNIKEVDQHVHQFQQAHQFQKENHWPSLQHDVLHKNFIFIS